MTDPEAIIRDDRLSVSRLTMTGAVVTLFLFALCWVAGALGFVGSHAFIGLFTLSPVLSVTALCIGGFSAAVFGGIGGAAIAFSYNLLGSRVV